MADRSGQWGIEYDPEGRELTVTFPNGVPYIYEGVEPDVVERFQKAESKGTFFNQFIRGIY